MFRDEIAWTQPAVSRSAITRATNWGTEVAHFTTAERKIEARRGWKRGQLERRRNLKGGIELGWPGQFRRKPPGERSKQAGREKAEVERSALHLSSTRAITSKSTRVIGIGNRHWQI